MIVVIISDWFSEGMGYAENHLPAFLAREGAEVHVVSSDLQIYATDQALYSKVYEPNLGPPIVPCGVKKINGFTLHRLSNYRTPYGIGITALKETLARIKPDIVYLFEIAAETTLQAIACKKELGYKLFTESRMHRSVFTPPSTLYQRLKYYFSIKRKWRKAGEAFEKCYPVAPDVLEMICKYLGQEERKCELSSLAVDTTLFVPPVSPDQLAERKKRRKELGFSDPDIVCIYTGRFNDDKGPLILARAIGMLHAQGHQGFKALFIGAGEESYIESMKEQKGCVVHPFVPSAELVKYYQAADIGVWPKQESTSQLDAAACGLPLILSSRVADTARIEGNGLSYEHESYEDLAARIRSLEALPVRKQLGNYGVDKIQKLYSWKYIARKRLLDFEKALACI
ncbi:MAG: glycosyltransferase family 4 protein [Bacteroidia bacterium]